MRRTVAISIAFALVFAAGMAMSGWALYERFEQTNARRDQQAAFNERIRELSFDYCQEIEDLKAARREQARLAFQNLDRDLRLLGIAKTPELVRAARASRDGVFRRFAAAPCPRPTGGQP
jgi:hypothetical protein